MAPTPKGDAQEVVVHARVAPPPVVTGSRVAGSTARLERLWTLPDLKVALADRSPPDHRPDQAALWLDLPGQANAGTPYTAVWATLSES